MNRELFAQRIKELRLKKNITQSELGTLLSVTKTQISDIEKGKTTTSLEKLSIIADCFDVSTDYLLGRTDDPRRY
ncbi:helix-turn-helix domain-containing protein [Paenibacillus popilliae]|uniref:helix-turn-helix domain-containing protein n=1 Tax=Paenibacillus popilliae TaxID=78057 RepID=UPI001F3C8FA3|nr:helix-turn-helix transcriptional regulator [Paenibacillus popilliae]